MTQQINKDTVIIGAGLTGLTLAHKLNQKNQDFLVLEKNSRPGGVIQTKEKNGFVYEAGPNTGIVKYGEVAELFEELSSYCTPEIPDDSVKKRFIWKNGRWHQLPSGLKGGVQTKLFSWKDKFRILGEPFRKPGKDPHESLDKMVRRRMGESFLNYAVDPFILGVYAGDPSKIIPKYALPKLYYLEQDYGSFIGGAVKKKKEKKDPVEKKATKDVFSIKNGLENLVKALYNSAGNHNFLLETEDINVKPIESGGFEVKYKNNETFYTVNAKNVILTVGAYELKNLLNVPDTDLLDTIENLKYAKVIHAAVGFNKWEGVPLSGFGGLVPFVEKRDILGALFMSAFLSGRAPEKGELLSVFLGGTRREDIFSKSDEEIKELIEKELKSMFNLTVFQPDLLELNRYEHAIPQYGKESGERFSVINQLEQKYPGLILAGNMRDGIGMADRIKQANDIANRLKEI
ncbi:MAG: protoporphyrinogen oxidase [Bacteroidota bacterium]